MNKRLPASERKIQILQTLAKMLESAANSKITTAALAEQSGISEATLYRHFTNKAQILEGLITFAEETVFSLAKQISKNVNAPYNQIKQTISMLQSFALKNPGICRLIIGNNLIGEKNYLRERANQFFRRLETQFKQILRLGQAENLIRQDLNPAATANFLTAIIIGQWHRFANSEFNKLPTEFFESQWQEIEKLLTG